MQEKTAENMTLRDHAEAWWTEQGKNVPPHNTLAWHRMYRKWINYAFPLPQENNRRLQ